ncbi:lipopolysaccharide heptosyltransferase II [Chitinilyticum litopenaei]|uniref:lipopolysaccharide heptosyltransferase II n=2 Tax=Chitinilyticum piscinae TaxID=2866724 RepID=A0A8J7FJ43_9NEIS|nr:lipopolysaccharide heptosyltransferase II [Chitinilyticum piscinae]
MKKILIVAPAWIGDAIMAQPLYMRLHQRHPGLQLDVLAPAWTRPLHARMPEVHQAIDNPFGHGELGLRKRWQLGRQLKAAHYDQVIVLPNSLKSALVPWFARIPLRTGWVGEARYGLLNDSRKLDPYALPLMVERFVALAEPAGQAFPRPAQPRLSVDTAQRDTTRARLKLPTDLPIVAICPGAEYGPAKRWPARHAAALSLALLERGYQVWLFGSDKDAPIAGEIAAQAPGVVDLTGKTSLSEAIDLMSLARGAVCNDSGLMHVAAALNLPLVALYGSSSPEFTPPLSHRAQIVSLDLDCAPCFERTCPLGHMNCLNELEPQRVLDTLLPMLPSPITKFGV